MFYVGIFCDKIMIFEIPLLWAVNIRWFRSWNTNKSSTRLASRAVCHTFACYCGFPWVTVADSSADSGTALLNALRSSLNRYYYLLERFLPGNEICFRSLNTDQESMSILSYVPAYAASSHAHFSQWTPWARFSSLCTWWSFNQQDSYPFTLSSLFCRPFTELKRCLIFLLCSY